MIIKNTKSPDIQKDSYHLISHRTDQKNQENQSRNGKKLLSSANKVDSATASLPYEDGEDKGTFSQADNSNELQDTQVL